MRKFNYRMHHQWLCAPRIGTLKPMFHQEVTPGDTWKGRTTAVFRLSPLDVPAYMSLKVHVAFFFVPHRLIWNTALGDDANFEDVITGVSTGTWPQHAYSALDIMPHDFGHGSTGSHTRNYNALPLRAFNLIWNDFFRNPHTTSEVDITTYKGIHRVNFPQSDYFGSYLTEYQQGVEASATVTAGSPDTVPATEIRDALRSQAWKERRSQFGERYRDLLRSLGVRTPDARLDRPEVCARAATTIGVSEVVATATSTSENTGDYRGHGIAGLRVNFPARYFPEHGTLLGVMFARPRLQLRNRKDPFFNINTPEELYHPEYAGNKMVLVHADEVYQGSTDAGLGYQEQYEYLRKPRDTIAGSMLEVAQEPWTAHVDLSAVPTVAFLQQVQDYDHIYQDQTSTRADIHSFFDHRIGKRSIIVPRNRKVGSV